MKTAAEYRRIAKGNLQGKWGAAIGATLLYGLIVGGLSFAGIGIILAGPLAVGLALFFIRLTRKGAPEINSLFEPFNNFVNTFVMGLLKGIFIALWSLLFIIPGIVKSYAYAMSEYIMADDPTVDGMKAIDISKKMMNGKKGKLFSLYLSIMWPIFIAYILLYAGFALVMAEYVSWHSGGAVLSGIMWIGMAIVIISAIAMIPISLFLTPYYYGAQAAFYEDAKAEYFQGGNGYVGNGGQGNQYGQQPGGPQGPLPPYNNNYYGPNQYGPPPSQGGYYNPNQQNGNYGNNRQGGSIYGRFYGENQQGGDEPDRNNNNNNPPPNPF